MIGFTAGSKRTKFIRGVLMPASDKSITHRALILSGMSTGTSFIVNPLISKDTVATMNVLRAMGVQISQNQLGITVISKGYAEFVEPAGVLDCGNSGTTARLLAGVIAPRGFVSVLTGDESLRSRPMARVIEPLQSLGCNIFARGGNTRLPMGIAPYGGAANAGNANAGNANAGNANANPNARVDTVLRGKTPSAQVKSAILLAGVQLEGSTTYEEPCGHRSRDHTERLLPLYGADISVVPVSDCSTGGVAKGITVRGGSPLVAADTHIPGDISSASFFIAAVFLWQGSSINVQGVGLNPTRVVFLDILIRMGANISYEVVGDSVEPAGFIDVEYAMLTGIEVSPDETAAMVDEIPLLMMLAVVVDEPIIIHGIGELRLKESDRIMAMTTNLLKVGVVSEIRYGGAGDAGAGAGAGGAGGAGSDSTTPFETVVLHPRKVASELGSPVLLESYHDHRIAMINTLLAKYFHNNIAVDDVSSIDVSFPSFLAKFAAMEG